MNKIPCTSQNTEAKTLPADVCIFGRFGRLSPAAVQSADCWLDSVLSHIYAKTPFCCVGTVANNTLNHQHVFGHSFLIDKCSCKMVNTLPSDTFNSSAISCNFNLWSAKTSLWSFLVFSEITAKFGWPEHSASFVSVRLHLKSAYHITLIKPLLCLNSTFSYQKAMLYQHIKFRFFHCFEICNSSFT